RPIERAKVSAQSYRTERESTPQGSGFRQARERAEQQIANPVHGVGILTADGEGSLSSRGQATVETRPAAFLNSRGRPVFAVWTADVPDVHCYRREIRLDGSKGYEGPPHRVASPKKGTDAPGPSGNGGAYAEYQEGDRPVGGTAERVAQDSDLPGYEFRRGARI